MHKESSTDIRISHKIRFWIPVIGLAASLIFTQTKNQQNIESADAIKMESGDSIISPDKARAIALNSLQTTENGAHLSHPNHSAEFDETGVFFKPRQGPQWGWSLSYFGNEENSFEIQPTNPENAPPRIVTYSYEFKGVKVKEEYHAKQRTVEQRFVLEEPLPLNGQDLIIKGIVATEGQFEKKEPGKGWAWKDDSGEVSLGDVTVFDAEGHILMASMQVTAQSTEIIVDAGALANATYPVTVDPEIGANDLRISDMGPDGKSDHDAIEPAVAYNVTTNEYLVVWSGDDGTFPLVVDEHEIFGQRINAATGKEVGSSDFRISNMGTDGDTDFNAFGPAIAYNSTRNEYLVVWRGTNSKGFLDAEYEIFGQLLAADGTEIGSDFRISHTGPEGDLEFDANEPAVAYNSTSDEYLVVWGGNMNIPPSEFAEEEIFGQLLAADGTEIGSDFRISDVGPDGVTSFYARNPAIVYNFIEKEYFVAWYGNGDSGREIYGQRIDGIAGTEVGVNDFPISDMGVDRDPLTSARFPKVTYNSTDNEYFVVWEGIDEIAFFLFGESEIYGQRIDGATGAEVGTNDIRISDMGPDGNTEFHAETPNIAYSSAKNEYLVIWSGDDDTFPLVEGEREVFCQRVSAEGIEIGVDTRVSDMGLDGNTAFSATTSSFAGFTNSGAVVYNPANNKFLISWSGDDDTSPLTDNEFEVYIQEFTLDPVLASGAEAISLSGMSGPQTVDFTLDAGPENAFLPYIVLGSLSGKSPGTAIGSTSIPLNPDAYTLFTLNNVNSAILANNFGNLDKNGRATISLSPPNNSNLIGRSQLMLPLSSTPNSSPNK